MRYTRGQLLLRAQGDRNPPLGDPSPRLNAATVGAWRAIAAVCPPVLRFCDSLVLEMAARHLVVWHHLRAEGVHDRSHLRTVYRTLGTLFAPMAARRSLLFGDSTPPSRSRRA
jgi:hypothetical protein